MKLKGSDKKAKISGPNPFEALATQNVQPGGPGIGVNREDFFKAPAGKRRSPAATALGETPMRDGPFQFSAKPLARQMPPKARVRAAGTPSGPNPFDESKPK